MPGPRQHLPMRARGFTLIELSVALLLAGLLLAVAIPGLSRLLARVRFDAELRQLENGIAALPRLAWALGEEGTLAHLAERHLEIPDGWVLVGADAVYIRSSGLCAGGSVRVLTPGGERELLLTPPFCRVGPAP
jgi:prepilin-type N-terminal cleavage/methylation domain-containing protein